MRILHTMLRVGNLDRSIKFYTDVLGMKVMRTSDHPAGKFTLVFLGYGDAPGAPEIELTYNYGVEKYEIGSAYGHIALEVDDAQAACQMVKERGGKVTREAGAMKDGRVPIAFIEDPDGYKIEFIQKH